MLILLITLTQLADDNTCGFLMESGISQQTIGFADKTNKPIRRLVYQTIYLVYCHVKGERKQYQ